MKHLILTTALCLSLTACETVSNMTWPSFGFGDDPVEKVEIDSPEMPAVPVATVNQSAIQTELDEMEKLTGTRMKIQDFVSPQDPVVEPIMVVEETVIEDIEIIEVPSVDDMNAQVIKAEAKMAEMQQDKIEIVEESVTEIVKPATPSGCPNIQIIPATKSITRFNPKNPTQMTARASITNVRGGCEIVNGGMEIDLDILMRGTITNKGRFEGKVNEEAFVTFPYFVSVIKPDGMPADKKILATAMRFRPSVDYVDHAEKITQFVPMGDVTRSANYTITVGYQLTREQLSYNKMEIESRPNDMRASPDTSKAKRRSYNPLAGE